MKKLSILIFMLTAVSLFPGSVFAQEKAQTTITSVTQKDETVNILLESTKPFLFADNRYILYIGDKEFFLNRQSHKDGKGYMTFMIPAADFNNLKEGEHIYLSYGDVNTQRYDLEDVAKGTRCWSLGVFSKNLLK